MRVNGESLKVSLRALSLFSGIGGLDLAAEWAGFTVVGQVEYDDYCLKVLQKHWPSTPKYTDIRTFSGGDIGSVDLIFGGPPCQPRSLAGRRQGSADPRDLWPEMRRVVSEVHPSAVVAENPIGVLSMGIEDWCDDLESEGYETGVAVLPAASVGAAHIRDRVFLLGYRISFIVERARSYQARGLGETQSETPRRWKARICDSVAYSGGTGDEIVSHSGSKGLALREGWTGDETPGREAVVGSRGRFTQSRLGGDDDGISRGLDEHRVAPIGLRGEQQETWEPSRTAVKLPNRKARLHALGNSVVPQQALPVFQVIADWLTVGYLKRGAA